MKTRTFRRIARITLFIIIILIIFLLMRNRNKIQNELAVMQNFNDIVPVEIATVRLTDFTPELTESGIYMSKSNVLVVSETQGKIIQLDFSIGDRVTAGQILATVESEVVKSRFELAKENLIKAEKDLERFRELESGEAATLQQLEAAKLARQEALTNLTDAKKQLENTTIKAPISGTVSERHVEYGTYLTSGMPVCNISDQSRMNFQAKLAEGDIQELSVGQTVSLKADALPSRTFQGEVKNIGVVADLSGRYLIEIDVPNTDRLLRSGMIGQATFHLTTKKNRLVIPRKCINGSLHHAHVFVLDNNNVIRRSVIVELLNSELVAVISGLQPDEKVVTTGQINLADGSSVKVLNNLQKTIQP